MSAFYKEKQRFTQAWLWAIVLVSTIPVIGSFTYGFIKQFIFNQPWGSEPMSDLALLFLTIGIWILLGGIVWFFLTSELHVEIRDKAIFFKFPILRNSMMRYGFESIKSWKIKEYNAILDYGGLGIRTLPRKKKAYIVKGKYGLQFFLKDGRNILIGTQTPKEMEKAMQQEWDRFHNKF